MRYVLFYHSAGCELWLRQRRQEACIARFEPTAEGLGSFEAWLDGHAPRSVVVLVDVADEAFQVETLPVLWGRERRALIDRKLTQWFRQTPLRAAHRVGRGREGARRGERVLFAALTAPARLEAWLQALDQRAWPLAGVFSVAALIEPLLTRLGYAGSATLVATVQLGKGVRLTARTREGFLASWLDAEAAVASPSVLWHACRRFLEQWDGLRALPPDAPLRTLVLADAPLLAALRLEPVPDAVGNVQLLTPADAWQRGGNRRTRVSSLTALWVRLLAARRPLLQYAPASLLQHARRARLGQLTRGACLATALLALAGAALLIGWGRQREAESDDLQRALTRLRLADAAVRRQLPDGATLSRSRTLLAVHRTVERWPRLQPRLERLSRLLDAAPTLRLERLVWRAESATYGGKGGETASSAATRLQPPDMVSLDLEFTALAAVDSPRQALAEWSTLRRGIEASGGTVVLREWPRGLSGDTTSAPAAADDANRLAFRVSWPARAGAVSW